MISIVRHGRTAANAAGMLLGHLDAALDDEGLRQATAVAGAFAAGDPVDRIIASPLARTRATARVIADQTGVPVELDEQWIELDYGDYDGMALTELPEAVWSTWRSDPTFRPPGGESLLDLGTRVRAAADRLAEPARTDHIVVVSHVSPIKAAVAWALGIGDEVTWRMFVTPASITRIGIAPHGPVLRGFNDSCHL
jgi:broad specificity phosphatase PhoE